MLAQKQQGQAVSELQAPPALPEGAAVTEASSEAPGAVSGAEEEAGGGAGQDAYGSSGAAEEQSAALTGRDPRLSLLWEWQCPLPQSVNLSTRVTCMAWNKVCWSHTLQP